MQDQTNRSLDVQKAFSICGLLPVLAKTRQGLKHLSACYSGLFVQYLKAGKVPGAKTTGDVKRHYESMVPAGRGCRVEDVIKAIKYVVDQEYETGQALPVTGGQIMLS